jgi:phage-related protein
MALTIGELVGFIRADGSDFERGIARSQLRMAGFNLDTNNRLRDLRGHFVDESEAMGRALADNTADGTGQAARVVTVYSSVVDAEMRSVRGRFQRAAQAAREMGDDLGGVFGRIRADLGRLNVDTDRLRSIAGGIGAIAAGAAPMAATLGAAIPVAASLVATLANVAPAGAVAVTAQLAVKQASAVVKLGMMGVEDAVAAAFDPSKAEEFEEALKKLSPEARAFALAVKELAPEFKALQQQVQNELFRGLSDNLSRTATSVLPVLRTELTNTATALGDMAAGALGAARELADNGTLGKAMGSASKGLSNLSGVPGIVVTALGQLAAAAGPSFESLTAAAADGAAKIGERLGKAFESGALEDAIETAIDLLGQLFDIGANVFDIIGSVFGAAEASGGGFLGVLEDITGEIAKVAATDEVQDALKSLFSVMATIGETAGPLLALALKAIAPILTALGPPIETVIEALGAALTPILEALEPVLGSAAKAVGALIEAVAPLLPVAGELVAALLPALVPLFDALAVVFKALAPVVGEVASIIADTLTPVIEGLTPVIEPLAALLADQLVFWLEMLGDLLVELGPSLVILGEALGELLVALGPLIEAWGLLSTELLTALMPLLEPLIELIGKLAAWLADDLADTITNVVVPAIEMFTALLRGDFDGALEAGKRMVRGFVDNLVERFTELPFKVAAAMTELTIKLRLKANEAGLAMVEAMVRKRTELVQKIAEIPGKARDALGNLGSYLSGAGRSLIRGFIIGIYDMIGSVREAASDVVSAARDFFPFSPAKKGPFAGAGYTTHSGRALIEGFRSGIAERLPALRAQLEGLGAGMPDLSMGGAAAGMTGMPSVIVQTSPRVVVDPRAATTDKLIALVQEWIRVEGGDVQQALGG